MAPPIEPRRIAVIGAGVSGIAAAHALMKFGHQVVVYDKAEKLGGVWAFAYPGVHLQNIAEHYRLTDFPWPFKPELHPPTEEVMRYWSAAVAALKIDVRLGHDVEAMEERPGGWLCTVRSAAGTVTEPFDYVVIATGQYSDDKEEMTLPGRDLFRGAILTERELPDLETFRGRRVAVVGFGKTAVDLATFATESGAAEVHHLFRGARWLIPRFVAGRHMSHAATARSGTTMMPSWVHSRRLEAMLHKYLPRTVKAYWKITEMLFRRSTGLHQRYRDPAARARMKLLEPGDPVTYHMRGATALAPDTYYGLVRDGVITPHRGSLTGFTEDEVILDSGETIAADLVVLALGNKEPSFRFLPEKYRAMMHSEPDGVQLFRHLVHPAIPNLAFAGFNHSFMHIPCVEVGMIWYGALIAGDLALPSVPEMEASRARVAAWKRQHMLFEPTRAYGIGNRFHHYLDVLLKELGVSHNRKPSWLAERREAYVAADYDGVFAEYMAARTTAPHPRQLLPFDT